MARRLLHGALLLTGAGLALTACESNNRALRGAAIGGAGGAVVGAVVPGVSTVEGAAVGAAAGAVIGAVTHDGRKYDVYRDDRGREYWTDRDGRRHYRRR